MNESLISYYARLLPQRMKAFKAFREGWQYGPDGLQVGHWFRSRGAEPPAQLYRPEKFYIWLHRLYGTSEVCLGFLNFVVEEEKRHWIARMRYECTNGFGDDLRAPRKFKRQSLAWRQCARWFCEVSSVVYSETPGNYEQVAEFALKGLNLTAEHVQAVQAVQSKLAGKENKHLYELWLRICAARDANKRAELLREVRDAKAVDRLRKGVSPSRAIRVKYRQELRPARRHFKHTNPHWPVYRARKELAAGWLFAYGYMTARRRAFWINKKLKTKFRPEAIAQQARELGLPRLRKRGRPFPLW